MWEIAHSYSILSRHLMRATFSLREDSTGPACQWNKGSHPLSCLQEHKVSKPNVSSNPTQGDGPKPGRHHKETKTMRLHFYEVPRGVKFIKTESRKVIARG